MLTPSVSKLTLSIVVFSICVWTVIYASTPAHADVGKGYLPREPYVAPHYVPPPPRKSKVHLTDNGDGTITDGHGLMWTHEDSYSDLGHCLNWHQANEYVKGLKTGGHTDWRLPTLMELVGIYDDTKETVMGHDHDPEHTMRLSKQFADGSAYWLWTSDAEFTKLTDCCAKSFYFPTGMTFIRRFTFCSNGGARAVRSSADGKRAASPK